MNEQGPAEAGTPLAELELSPPVWLGDDVTIRDVAGAMTRTGASAAAVFGQVDTPPWLAGLRFALRVEV